MVDKPFSRYLLLFFACYFCLVAVNTWVDPQRILPFQLSDQPKYFAKASRVEKAARLIDEQFDTIVFGSSRVMTGINPDHMAFKNKKVYNLAVKAIAMNEYSKILDYVQEHQKIKHLYFGLDFDSFGASLEAPGTLQTVGGAAGQYEKSLYYSTKGYAFHLIEYLLSGEIFVESLRNTFPIFLKPPSSRLNE